MKKLLLAFLTILCFNAQSQSQYWKSYSPTTFTISIGVMAIDDNNVKWMSHRVGVGLASLDDTTWTNYTPSNSGIPNEGIISIATEGSNVWLGTASGLTKFDGITWTTYSVSFGQFGIQAIGIEGATKWLLTQSGLTKFDGVNWTDYTTTYSVFPGYGSISIEKNGTKWMATRAGLAKFDGINWTNYNTSNSGLTSDFIYSIAVNTAGAIWIAHSSGLSKFDGTNWTNYPLGYYSIDLDQLGNLWAAGPYDGLIRFDGINDYSYINDNNSLLFGYSSVKIDKEGNKWCVPNSNSLEVFSKKVFADFIINYDTLNASSNVNFTNHSKGAYSYNWDFGDPATGLNNTSSLISPNHIFSSVGTFTVSLSATDSAGIEHDDIYKTVFINPPHPDFNVNSFVINPGGVLTFTNTSTGGLNYEWKENGILFSNNVNPSPKTYSITGSYAISLTAINGPIKDSISKIIMVSKPELENICMLTVDSASNKNMVVWQKSTIKNVKQYNILKETTSAGVYSKIGSVPAKSLSVFIDTTSNPAQSAARYKLAVVDSFGNESEQSALHKTLHLTITPGQSNTWSLLWDDYLGFTFSTYDIYRGSSIASMQKIASIQNNLFSFTDLTPPLGNLYYAIQVVNPNTCTPTAKRESFSASWSNIVNNFATSVNEFNPIHSVKIIPNPSNGSFTINTPTAMNYTFELFNITGKKILGKKVMNTTTESIDITSYSKGLYFLKITSMNGVVNQKVVVE